MNTILLRTSFTALLVVGMFAGNSWASSINDYISGTGYDTNWADNGAEYFILTDTDSTNDDSTWLQIQTDLSGDYTLGIYDWDGANENSISTLAVIDTAVMDEIELIAGTSIYSYTGSVSFDLSTETVTSYYDSNVYDDATGIDESFGFYIQFTDTSDNLVTYYSESILNDGADYFAAFYNSNGLGSLGLFDLAIGIDIGDGTALFAVSDVTPVPEPGSMLLFGTGIVCLSGIYRLRKKSK